MVKILTPVDLRLSMIFAAALLQMWDREVTHPDPLCRYRLNTATTEVSVLRRIRVAVD